MASDEFRAALGRAEERINERQDRLIDRVEESFDRIFAKIDMRLDAADKTSEIERAAVKQAIGELRDGAAIQGRLIQDQGKQIAELEQMTANGMRSSAEGAARGAGEAAGAVAVRAAAIVAADRPRPFLQTFWGKAVVVGTGVSALAGAIGLIPNIIKYGDLLLHFIGGLAK